MSWPAGVMTDDVFKFIFECINNETGNKMIYTVMLEDGTVGDINSNTLGGQSAADFIGEYVNVHLQDENGNPIEVQGVMSEVLAESCS